MNSTISPPGDTIAECMAIKKISLATLAQELLCTEQYVRLLIHGEAAITEQVAYRLEKVLGPPASFWITRQKNYSKLKIAS